MTELDVNRHHSWPRSAAQVIAIPLQQRGKRFFAVTVLYRNFPETPLPA
jgi:hypothetical protein